MTARRRRTTTGNRQWDEHVDTLLDDIGASEDRDLVRDLLSEGIRLAVLDVERLDLKIASAALREMRKAFTAFAPVRDRRKVTVFGSARTAGHDPLYTQARDLAEQFAAHGWMVVTGAGPGIMLAAMEGAGRENSFGVSIRLPFETDANPIIAGDPKLVSMKYFFTRKLMLMKESAAYIAMPGGFGTLDETMELITLQQTGKAVPAPVVLLDVPGGDYWHGWRRFITEQVESQGYVGSDDLAMVYLCDDHLDALAYVEHFYANYRSIRWVGDVLVVRLRHAPTDADLVELNRRFGDITIDGAGLARTEAMKVERADEDDLGAERIKLRLNPFRMADLHHLINALNDLSRPVGP